MEKDKRIIEKRGKFYFYRLSETDRKQHNLMFLIMFILFVTGFPLRFYGEWWAPRLYDFVGGAKLAPTIHRFAGLALIGLFLLHILTVVRAFLVNRMPVIRKGGLTTPKIAKEILAMEMAPKLKDLRDIVHHIMYLLYFKGSPPKYGRMTWREKMDYLALYRGIPVVALTGLLIWQSDLATRFIPGIVLNIAYIVHSYEVTLILLSVVGFHWYNVHYSPEKFPMSHAFITGYIPEDETMREHYEEYEEAMKEAGFADKLREACEIKPAGVLEKTGYKLFTLVLILFFIWFMAVATRYIYYSLPAVGIYVNTNQGKIRASGRDSLSGCVHCHTDVPHAESNEVMEPFLNMHSSFLACETCHIKRKEVAFRWYEPVSGKIAENPSIKSGKRGDYGVKISSGMVENGRFIYPKVAEKEIEAALSRRNHRNLSKDPIGCLDCHKKEGGYLPLGELGYSVEQIAQINGSETIFLIENYQKIVEEAGQ